MKHLFIMLAVLVFSKMSYSQNNHSTSDTAAIKQTFSTLFDSMRKGDSTSARTVFLKGMVFQRISNNKDGKTILLTEDAVGILKAIGTPHAAVYDERIVYDAIKIDGDLACVWAPYKFYLGDQFSHCGVDVFQLMRTADGWKIIYFVDTRRKGNCIP